MHVIWKGQLEVGKLVIPVGLAATRQERRLGLRTLHKGRCLKPVRERKYCETHDKLLDEADLVRGYETAPGKFLPLTAEEIEQTRSTPGRVLKISSFVPEDALPAAATGATYFLTPDTDKVAAAQYSLLQETLAGQKVVGLSRMHWRTEWLTAIRTIPGSRALLLERLCAEDEIVSPAPIDKQLAGITHTADERDLAGRLVAERTRKRPPRGSLRNREAERLRELVERKLAGDGDDLAGLLERSLKQAPAKKRRRARQPA